MFKKILLSTVVSFIAVSSVQAMEDGNSNTETRSYSPLKFTVADMVTDILSPNSKYPMLENPTWLGVDVNRNLQTALENYTPEALEALHRSSPACFQNEMSGEGRAWIVTSLALCSPEQLQVIAPRLSQLSPLLPKDEDGVDYTLLSALAQLSIDQIGATLDNVSRLLPQGVDAKKLVASLAPLSADEIRAKAAQK